MTRSIAFTLALSLGLAACGGSTPTSPSANTPTPTPTTPPTPAQVMVAMDGVVGETAPTTATRVPNPILKIVDGPSAGTTVAGDSSGYFLFGSIAAGTFRVEVSAQNYETNTFTVTRNSSGSFPFNIKPALRTVSQTFNDSISGGDARCQTTLGQQPCKIFRIGVHHDGQMEVVLNWGTQSNDLDLDVYQDTLRIANSGAVRGTEERITTAVRAGLSYEVRVFYWRGSTIENFSLRIVRPS